MDKSKIAIIVLSILLLTSLLFNWFLIMYSNVASEEVRIRTCSTECYYLGYKDYALENDSCMCWNQVEEILDMPTAIQTYGDGSYDILLE